MPLGELAALITALCWTGTSTFFSLAGQQVGAVIVNRARLLLALCFLIVTHSLLYQQPLPLDALPSRWGWLAVSGVIGLVVGDAMLFQAFIWIGARLSMLMLSLSPVVAVLFAWLFLGETLSPREIFGMLVTVGGIGWVVMGRPPRTNTPRDRDYGRGLLFGLGAAASQALGLTLAKKGLWGDFPALSGNVIRMLAAVAVVWALTLARREAGSTVRRLMGQRPALAYILGGTTFGPFIGVWLSLVAIQLTDVGIASTLMALPPIFLLPVGHYIFKERISWQAIVGTFVAIGGVAILLMG